MPKFSRTSANAGLPTEGRSLYDISEAAERLSIDVPTLQHWVAAGFIRTVRRGTKLLIPRSEIAQLDCKRMTEKMSAFLYNKEPQMTGLLYCRENAAAVLDISVRALDYLFTTKRLKYRRIGRKVLVHHKDLERFSRSDQPRRLRPPKPHESEKPAQSPTELPLPEGDNGAAEEPANE